MTDKFILIQHMTVFTAFLWLAADFCLQLVYFAYPPWDVGVLAWVLLRGLLEVAPLNFSFHFTMIVAVRRSFLLKSLAASPACCRRNLSEEAKLPPLENTLQKVSRLVSDRHPAFRLSEEHRKSVSSLAQPNGGQLANFWLDVFVQRPDLMSLGAPALLQWEQRLRDDGGRRGEMSTFLLNCPFKMLRERTSYLEQLDQWVAFCRSCNIHPISALAVIPQVLAMKPHFWLERKHLLSQYFSGKELFRLLDLCPGVLLDDEESMANKLEFLFYVMHVSPHDIASSGVLAKDLETEIRPRYLFLERAGLYKHPHPKSVGMNSRAEPPVHEVVNTPLDEFLGVTAGAKLSAEEYNTFLSVLHSEDEDVFDDHEAVKDEEEEELWGQIQRDEAGYRNKYLQKEKMDARKNKKKGLVRK